MKDLREFVKENLNEDYINEGFLDKLTKAIDNVVNHTDKFMKIVNDNIDKMKDSESVRCIKKEDPEAVAKELDSLNNENDIKAIYKYVKTLLKDDSKDDHSYGLTDGYHSVDKVIKDIKDTFKCDDNKALAIYHIASAIAIAIVKDKPSLASKYSKYTDGSKEKHEYSSSSHRSSNAGFTSAVAAAIAVM